MDYTWWPLCYFWASLVCSDGKESTYNAQDPGSIPGLERSPGEGNGNPLQHSCLENPMDWGAWRATVHVTTDTTERVPFLFFSCDQYWWASFNTEIPGQRLQAQLPETGHLLRATWWKSSGWRPSHWAEGRGPWWDRIQRHVKEQTGHSIS